MTEVEAPAADASSEGWEAFADGWSLNMIIDPDFASNPRPFYDRLRQGPPRRDDLAVPGRQSSVVVTRNEDVARVLRDPATFSSRFGEGLGGLGNDRPLIPLQIDPPDHRKYRVLLDPYFGPKQMAKLEEDLAALVNQLIDVFIDRGRCDLVADLAVPFPCTAFLRLMGLPLDDLDLFLRIKDGIIRGNGEIDLEKQAAARAEAGQLCYDYFDAALNDLQKVRREGLLCDLLEAEVDGVRLTREEILDVCFLFIIAGLDTVTDSMCCFWSFLAEQPEHRQRIVDDPSVIPNAIEELLRWQSPVAAVARAAATDTEIDGCPVRQGDSVLVFIGAANTDPAAFDDADGVDFGRLANRHHAFGGGVHRCLGSHLARLELRVVLREWHRRIPSYQLEPGAQLTWTPMMRAVESLPLVFPVPPHSGL